MKVGDGTSSGPPSAWITARAKNGRKVRLTPSRSAKSFLARARNATAIAAGSVELVLGGLEKVAGLPGQFDKIFSINVVQFLPDRAAAFATLLGKLAPGGTVATTYMPRHRNPTRADAERMAREIADILARAGFASIRIETLDLKPVPAVCVLLLLVAVL